ncbi:hypothetical protein IWQ60_006361 [Tieghemiomyces parasiticus]|uniref:Uncharacterized protein n=1 Tax=Tieghemiomyces parasiticus TaxID=78921 RepID=A0A9W8AA24_9FUNG|nr:hypothetical protein IWQ60_006361 [Tieghemiomyces parasiticus]
MTSVEVLELKQRVDALAAAVKYLRGENVHLKRHQLALPTANGLGASAALVLRQLPALPVPSPTTTTSPTATGAGACASPQLHELANETKSLLRDVQAVSASLKIVSLVQQPPTVASGDTSAGTTTTTASAWQPFQRTPQYAFTAQQTLVTTLQHRGQSLQSKIAALRQSSAGLKVPRLSVLAN